MRILHLIFVVLLKSACCSQSNTPIKYSINTPVAYTELIGVWQAESDEEGSAWLDAYQFFEDGKFKFNSTQFDGLKRIVSITGTYRVVDDTLFFKINSTIELVGGHLIRSKQTTHNDSWSIEEAQTKEIKYDFQIEETAFIERCEKSTYNGHCIMIDKRKYYKLQNNPHKY